ncbi:mannosyl-D-glycerate transport/metabolism system repressor MngR [Halobacillus andaensis]|uniref:Mannosyl-D-glycerate transport/metabolism system repressor MngR n=1 Tax=Halobacillus andaensis TaxID=1176239 RepID=A0A917B3X1_HALAA|nr:UTRA domain-containing protein [Halobacillus andaensis]MBP2004644.1 GntR family mannosyl-D-glycerate transport/metabolism transcriptional repressor [Halobacillus andaensis]GGF20073.1 mannosyl-D-glycerate transport/metabolism system repressor MngR [Halobacillus andaensis]
MAAPLYRRIAQKIKEDIAKGVWKEGEAIPTELHLSEQYQASRVTVRQAIKLLVEEGLLEKVQGSGTYVKEQKIEHNIFELLSFTEEMRKLNKEPINKILDFQLIEPEDHVRRRLQLSEGDKVFYVRRQRLVDDVPYVVEDTFLPVDMFPHLSYSIMTGSKYDYIEKQVGKRIKESFQEVIPILPSEDIAQALTVEETTPILKMESYSIFEDGTIFEYSENHFKSDEYKFTLRATRP